ncbi:hypothetical protein K9U39_11570 [Rhodoblastus acidophilus]|uniref:VOC family protein n=1 Tax=Candidatus Rhodoblastus alkanivorans TaxID=2954117 RepID=A0ABS9Z987_9HYPH|nr:hypothetical protein [Candidatus Rhodoblastus alkanivorans]MCI4680008.1 hypothetical protein [Candidatus Rhodoblastus alkanivorans]MCI4684250.1 hypothetical protein [Candidatus Rhodoblastus alkanivorans]MDI4641570.1 hypothetical protein [Rhodoblastus acidophilus]
MRKVARIALTAASRQDLVGAWTRLGFALDPGGNGVTLADGVALAFAATDDPARRAASVGLSAAPGAPPSLPVDEAAACFHLVEAFPAAPAPDHPNGALRLSEVAAIAPEPANHGEYLSALTGQREMLATSAGLEIRLDGGTSLQVLSPSAFAFRFGVTPQASGFRIAGLVFAVKNARQTEGVLVANKVMSIFQVGRLAAGDAEGVAVAFEQG